MPLKLGTTSIGSLFLGSVKIGKAYLGGTLVYQSVQPVIIVFEDPNVEAIAVVRWGNGTTLTDKQAAVVTTLSTYFRANTSIVSFNELEYFTGLTKINGGATSSGAFYGCTALEEVTLPNTVTEIQGYAFYNCSSLSDINLSNIETIGSAAFQNAGLVGLVLNCPNLETLQSLAFRNSGIKSIISLGSITQIPTDSNGTNGGCFKLCTSLESVVLPSTCISIGQSAFHSCSSLDSINLQYVETIMDYAFQNSSLAGVELNCPNLTTLQRTVFRNTGITKIVSLGSITTIPRDSSGTNGGNFAACQSLTSVILPNTLTSLGGYTFYSCPNLESVTFPTGQITIGRAAFSNCSKLASVTAKISSWDLEGEGYNTQHFMGCSSLTVVDLSQSTFTSLCDASYNSTTGAFRDCTNLETVRLPLTCTTIGLGSFYGCSKLATIIGTSNVTEIKEYTFNNCSLLSSIDLSSVQNIAIRSFISSGLTSVSLPSVVTITGNSTYTNAPFYNCSRLATVDIGSSCTEIGQYSFRNCTSLSSVTVRAVVPPTLGANAFQNTNSSLKIYVPSAAVADYQAATNWSSYASKIEAIP